MSDVSREITEVLFSERENESKHPTYNSEMGIYNLVAEGKIDEVKRIMASQPKPNDEVRGILSDNPIRNAMYHHVTMTAIITRVCISKGMPQDIAYKLSDVYIRKADRQTRVEDIEKVQMEAVEEFARYMYNSSRASVQSKQIIQITITNSAYPNKKIILWHYSPCFIRDVDWTTNTQRLSHLLLCILSLRFLFCCFVHILT